MGTCCSSKDKNENNNVKINNRPKTQGNNGRKGGKISCPYCFEPYGEYFTQVTYDSRQCAKCKQFMEINSGNKYKCYNCDALFHLKCVE